MDTKYKCINYQQQLESKAPCNYTSSQERQHCQCPRNLPRDLSCSHHPLNPSSEVIPIMTSGNHFLTLFIILPPMHLHQLPMAAGTNYHNLGALEQYKGIILGYCKLQVKDKSSWAKIKVSPGLCLFLEANPFPGFFSSFQTLEAPKFLGCGSFPLSSKRAMQHLSDPPSIVTYPYLTLNACFKEPWLLL